MHFMKNGYKRFLTTNSSDPRQRVPLIIHKTISALKETNYSWVVKWHKDTSFMSWIRTHTLMTLLPEVRSDALNLLALIQHRVHVCNTGIYSVELLPHK